MCIRDRNFAAQQLSKKQMNEVKGGDGHNPNQLWECHWEGGMTIIAEKDFPQLEEDMYISGIEEINCKMI